MILAMSFTASAIIYLLVKLLIIALIIGLIGYVATLIFPSHARIIHIICLVAFLIVLLILLVPILGL